MTAGQDPIADLIASDPAMADELAGAPGAMRHRFDVLAEDRYRLVVPEISALIEVDRVRREHGELIGELAVRCTLPGVKSFDGVVSIADFNLSSARARSERARLLTGRTDPKTHDIDWAGHLEEVCQRVLAAERAGQPAVDLRTLERPGPDDTIRIDGLRLPRRHPTIIFGDGGSAKSYLALYVLARLQQKGLNVALFDWELAGEDHRDRLERLFSIGMPKILYARCQRPLIYEADRLLRIIRDERINYAVFDSIAFACDGAPESAEIASRYFQALRKLGVIGSLHIAHITKSEGADQKPFGSVFWHNGARATYFVKLVESSPDGKILSIGLFNRKANLSGLYPPTGYQIKFTDTRCYFEQADPAETPDLAEKMTLRERMLHILKHGAVPVDELATELDAKPDSIRKTAKRHNKTFTLLEGGQVALLQRLTR